MKSLDVGKSERLYCTLCTILNNYFQLNIPFDCTLKILDEICKELLLDIFECGEFGNKNANRTVENIIIANGNCKKRIVKTISKMYHKANAYIDKTLVVTMPLTIRKLAFPFFNNISL